MHTIIQTYVVIVQCVLVGIMKTTPLICWRHMTLYVFIKAGLIDNKDTTRRPLLTDSQNVRLQTRAEPSS